MDVTVQLYATLKDKVGQEVVTVTLNEGATVGALKAALAEAYPVLVAHLPTTIVAVNQEYAFAEDVIAAGAEVAVFPPVSGG